MSRQSGELVEARNLKGFRDVLPAEGLIKTKMLHLIQSVFESFGYVPIETPHLEYTDVLIGAAAGEIGKQLFRFNDQGGRDVCLRFDLTVPFSRFVVQHKNELGMPFKRYAVGNVFRGESPQFGRYREFTQCDFDFVGTESLSADAEILEVITAIFPALGIDDFIIRINNRRLMNALAEFLGVPDKAAEMLRILDKVEKVGIAEVRRSLSEELAFNADQVAKLEEFVSLSSSGDNAQTFEKARAFCAGHAGMLHGLGELEEVMQTVGAVETAASKCKIDFSIARGLGYYTGIVYETYLTSLPRIGSVCGGGRYDNLTMNFSKEKLPGVGSSVGLDRLITALQELGKVSAAATSAKVLVTLMDAKSCGCVHKLAAELRAAGIGAEVYPEPAKLGKQFQYANRKGHAYVAIVGENEIKSGTVALKVMATGEQQTCTSVAELITRVK